MIGQCLAFITYGIMKFTACEAIFEQAGETKDKCSIFNLYSIIFILYLFCQRLNLNNHTNFVLLSKWKLDVTKWLDYHVSASFIVRIRRVKIKTHTIMSSVGCSLVCLSKFLDSYIYLIIRTDFSVSKWNSFLLFKINLFSKAAESYLTSELHFKNQREEMKSNYMINQLINEQRPCRWYTNEKAHIFPNFSGYKTVILAFT